MTSFNILVLLLKKTNLAMSVSMSFLITDFSMIANDNNQDLVVAIGTFNCCVVKCVVKDVVNDKFVDVFNCCAVGG